MIRTVLHECRIATLYVLHFITGLVPKKKGLILFTAWFGQKYIDSPKYVFEYCLENHLFHPVWYARSRQLYNELKQKGVPVVYSRSLKGVFCQMRAQMFLSTVQLNDYCEYFLSKAIFFDLGHGFPIKQSGFEEPGTSKRYIRYTLLSRKDITYYVCHSSKWVRDIGTKAFMLDKKSSVFCNKPRTDVLFDPELRRNKNVIVDQLKADHKAIVYMPTQRSMGKVPMPMSKLLDLDFIQSFCEKNDAVFFIKKHFYHRNEKENLDRYSRIFDITAEDIDPEVLTSQADVLISDYSAAYIDYLLLDRPVIFYAYDLDDYLKKERGLYVSFFDNHAGFKPVTKTELNDALVKLSQDWHDEEHKAGRWEIRRRYFDDRVTLGNTRQAITKIMQDMLNGTYKTSWEDVQ